MEPQCLYYKPPRLLIDPNTGKDYEGVAICDLMDKCCLVEYGNDYTEYKDFLEEVENETRTL
jgi:hypothetical protein